ncbi:MAG: formyltransferase [Casimicrobiaceae bacterium]
MAHASAVVFAYSNVGARCLRVLRAHGIDVTLVVTHADNPNEALWFERVADVAASLDLPVVMPADPNTPDFVARIAALAPDFIFSFYYRQMLSAALLAVAPRGAFNMHGSLLPQFRGRAPVNWAVLHGERATGATLHAMTVKPDAGDIIAQTAVPILPDDTAQQVFDKVTVAAEITLDSALPALLDGNAPRRAQDPELASYFGGRRPEDGTIDWSAHAATVHNLVRAVAPPYPGAFTHVAGVPARVLRTRVLDAHMASAVAPALETSAGALTAHCGGGGCLRILALEVEGTATSAAGLAARFGPAPLPLGAARA